MITGTNAFANSAVIAFCLRYMIALGYKFEFYVEIIFKILE